MMPPTHLRNVQGPRRGVSLDLGSAVLSTHVAVAANPHTPHLNPSLLAGCPAFLHLMAFSDHLCLLCCPGHKCQGIHTPLGTALFYVFTPLTLTITLRNWYCQYHPQFTDRTPEHTEMEALAQSYTAGRWQSQDSSQDACHLVTP